jgi:hypothetical protein
MMMSAAATRRAMPMPIWIARRGHREMTPAPSQDPTTAATIMRISVLLSYRDQLGKDEGLGDSGKRMPGVQRPRNELVPHHLEVAEDRRGGGEGADPQGVPEIGEESGGQPADRRRR